MKHVFNSEKAIQFWWWTAISGSASVTFLCY
ncbi:MAG: hypothetical protein A4E70_00110 [Syntrophus sp. PtaU1.Bin005]|nr:MAG: hypothetical protein A4E69_02337 [Syntrophus sp. PtaB.Bin138]OPY83600.1 MAG: hypothetical protein A4E70_00110 [Syntrophus sp. PtaU1.Bin005]